MSFVRWALVTVPAVLLLGFLSGTSVAAGSDNAWYQALAKPALTPPDWAFPVAWTILYVLIGLALAIVLNARGARERVLGISLFAVQLLANLMWTPLFFGWHRVVLALAVIVIMVLTALATTLVFGRIRPAAAWLMVPYLAWICFAGALTWGIHRLNPNADSLEPSAVSTQIDL
jgi:tryptophan-rich sensory protein